MGEEGKDGKSKIVVTGATGLIGGRIVDMALEDDLAVVVLARNEDKVRKRFGDKVEFVAWDCMSPDTEPWYRHLDGAKAVFHLAGTPLFSRRWSPDFLQRVADTRVESAHALVAAMEAVAVKPRVFVAASAIGMYGVDPEVEATEDAAPADDELARICIPWEAATQAARNVGVRSVQVRVGIVLSPESGALKEMLPPFRLGLGGVLGKPSPWINWIHIDDIARVFLFAMKNDSVKGPVNGVAPHPVTNEEFAKTLARVLKRPCLFRIPTLALRLGLGEAAKYLSGGARVKAAVLDSAGFDFAFESLDAALNNLLN